MKSVQKIDLGLTGYDELFMNDAERKENKLPRIYDIPLSEIDDFPDHPFKVKLDEDMDQLVQSIKERGIITPVTLRPKEDGRYEIVSGHRRKKACELAGFDTVKAEVREMTRDEAIILMVESNLQRSVILPSEKAFSYKMRLEAMRPNYLTEYFPKYIAKHGMPKMRFHDLRHPYVKHTTKIFSLRLMDFQAQAYPDARRKTRGACQLHRGGQSQSPVRPLCNRKQLSCLLPQSKMSWILYAISMRLSGYTSTRSISSSASSVVSVSASKIALDASMRLSCRACSSHFCFACANTAA